jgi:hypothetical protein
MEKTPSLKVDRSKKIDKRVIPYSSSLIKDDLPLSEKIDKRRVEYPRKKIAITIDSRMLLKVDKFSREFGVTRSSLIEHCVAAMIIRPKDLRCLNLYDLSKVLRLIQASVKGRVKAAIR